MITDAYKTADAAHLHPHYQHEPDAKATNAPGVNIDVTIHITTKYTHAGKHMQIQEDYILNMGIAESEEMNLNKQIRTSESEQTHLNKPT